MPRLKLPPAPKGRPSPLSAYQQQDLKALAWQALFAWHALFDLLYFKTQHPGKFIYKTHPHKYVTASSLTT
jgi:hypothetical protein